MTLRRAGRRNNTKPGPSSGQSTTVTFTYEVIEHKTRLSAAGNPLIGLRGIAKELFAELGGGENFIRSERGKFTGHQDK